MDLKTSIHQFKDVDPVTEKIATKIVDCGFKVHHAMGPGLLESAYEICLAHEMNKQGLWVERQKEMPLIYRDIHLEAGYRLDLLVEDRVIVEVKATETLTLVHQAQLHTYLKLCGKELGFLMNFNVRLFKKGIERIVMTNFKK